jgi:hypothetical protein
MPDKASRRRAPGPGDDVVRQAIEAGFDADDLLLSGKGAAERAGLESPSQLLRLLPASGFSEGSGKKRWYPESVLKELKVQREPRYHQGSATAQAVVVSEAGSLETQLERMLPGGPVARIEHELELENVRLRAQVELLQAEAKRLLAEIEVLQAENTRVVNVASRFGESLAEFLTPVKPTDK